MNQEQKNAAEHLGSPLLVLAGPGTGKTTIAKCYNNALGIDKLNCDRVKVGRGWSSFVDFIGYDNSFTGRFKYKDAFYRKFENENF